jgi:N-methylhydantoinase B
MSTALAQIVEEVTERVGRDVPSDTLRSALLDPGAAIADGRGRVLQCSSLQHLATLGGAARHVLAHGRFPLKAGDTVVVNDPFSGGTRVHDLYVLHFVGVPGAEPWIIVARVCMPDLGGDLFGAYNPRATEIWAEGARLTPFRIRSDASWARDTLACIVLNSRTPKLLETEVRAVVQALEDAAPLVRQAATQGFDALLADAELEAMTSVADHQNGVGEAALPDVDGIFVRVEVRRTNGKLTVDLGKSDPQHVNYHNAVRAVTLSAVLETLLDPPGALVNDGLLAPIEISTRHATIVDAAYPAPTGCGPITVAEAIRLALAAALGHTPPAPAAMKPLGPGGELAEEIASRLIQDEAALPQPSAVRR